MMVIICHNNQALLLDECLVHGQWLLQIPSAEELQDLDEAKVLQEAPSSCLQFVLFDSNDVAKCMRKQQGLHHIHAFFAIEQITMSQPNWCSVTSGPSTRCCTSGSL